jgi:hypothetical protein
MECMQMSRFCPALRVFLAGMLLALASCDAGGESLVIARGGTYGGDGREYEAVAINTSAGRGPSSPASISALTSPSATSAATE